MRIVLVQQAFHTNTAGIVNGLRARGHEVLPIVNAHLSGAVATPITGVEPVVVPYGRRSLRRWGTRNAYRLGMPRVRVLLRALRDFDPDVVIARDVRTTSVITFAIAKALGAVPVLWLLKTKLGRLPRWSQRPAVLILPRRRFHSGPSGLRGRDASIGRGLGRSRQLLLPLPFADPHVPHMLPNSPSDTRVRIVAVSSFSNAKKRLHWIPRAIDAAGLGEAVSVTFIGHGDPSSPTVADLREQFETLSLPAPSFLLELHFEDVLLALRSHHILAHPATKEEYGAVIPEAMSQGLAVLCSDRCAAGACFTDEESGLIFRWDDFEHFTSQLERLVRDATLRDRLRAAGFAEAREHLLPEVWAERLEQLVTAPTPGLWRRVSG